MPEHFQNGDTKGWRVGIEGLKTTIENGENCIYIGDAYGQYIPITQAELIELLPVLHEYARTGEFPDSIREWTTCTRMINGERCPNWNVYHER